jgi:hypothetical protein
VRGVAALTALGAVSCTVAEHATRGARWGLWVGEGAAAGTATRDDGVQAGELGAACRAMRCAVLAEHSCPSTQGGVMHMSTLPTTPDCFASGLVGASGRCVRDSCTAAVAGTAVPAWRPAAHLLGARGSRATSIGPWITAWRPPRTPFAAAPPRKLLPGRVVMARLPRC